MSDLAKAAAVEAGVRALQAYLGVDAASALKACSPEKDELAAFEYRLQDDYLGVARTLHIGFPTGFPDVPLTFRITPSAWLLWPHCMPSSLCLYTDGRQPSTASAEAAVASAMQRAAKLVAYSAEGADPAARSAEFASEIRSYWAPQLKSQTRSHLMLLDLPEATGELYVLTSGDYQLLSTEPESIRRYEVRRGLRSGQLRAPAKAAFFLRLTDTPGVKLPEPSIDAICVWLDGNGSVDDLAALREWLDNTSNLSSRWIVFLLPGKGVATWAMHIGDPGIKTGRSQAFHRRSGRRQAAPVPPAKPTTRVTLSASVMHVLAAQVVHSRNLDAARPLFDARVVVVGAGSLGSQCALQLARAGVGHIALIDDDALSDANLGRHVLGINDLGRSKVGGVARALRDAVPNVSVQPLLQRVQTTSKSLTEALDQADLVLVTTADWPSELFLWRLHAAGAPWTMIQTWSEPHSRVGHVLSSLAAGPSGESLFDAQGRFLRAFSKWPNDGLIPLPACGASFLPGAANRLNVIASLAVQVTLDALTRPSSSFSWHYTVNDVSDISALGGDYEGPILPEGVRSMAGTLPWPGLT